MADARTYRLAGLARLEEARILLDAERWSGAAYLAGRSVEAMLRALLVLTDRPLESGHDLRHLLRRVRESRLLSSQDEDRLHEAVNYLASTWQNNLRYMDDHQYLRMLKRRRMDRGMRGKVIATLTKRTIATAETIVERTNLIWERSLRK